MTRAGHLCEDTEVKGERVLLQELSTFPVDRARSVRRRAAAMKLRRDRGTR